MQTVPCGPLWEEERARAWACRRPMLWPGGTSPVCATPRNRGGSTYRELCALLGIRKAGVVSLQAPGSGPRLMWTFSKLPCADSPQEKVTFGVFVPRCFSVKLSITDPGPQALGGHCPHTAA